MSETREILLFDFNQKFHLSECLEETQTRQRVLETEILYDKEQSLQNQSTNLLLSSLRNFEAISTRRNLILLQIIFKCDT